MKYKGLFNIFKETERNKKQKRKQEIQKDQENLKSGLRKITSENPKYKEKYQLYTTKNAKNLRDPRQKVINLGNDYARIRSEAVYKSKQDETTGTGLIILTSKKMLQRLPIALAQAKAGNNSESLLNEIRQVIYSLHQSKEITEKVYKNIIKYIQV